MCVCLLVVEIDVISLHIIELITFPATLEQISLTEGGGECGGGYHLIRLTPVFRGWRRGGGGAVRSVDYDN